MHRASSGAGRRPQPLPILSGKRSLEFPKPSSVLELGAGNRAFVELASPGREEDIRFWILGSDTLASSSHGEAYIVWPPGLGFRVSGVGIRVYYRV